MHSTSGFGREVMGRMPRMTAEWRCIRETAAGTVVFRQAGLVSLAVIGMAGEDLLGAVELFQEHATHQEVRPGQRPQRQDRVGALDHRGTEALSAADRKGDR